jgi:hypothetical protein
MVAVGKTEKKGSAQRTVVVIWIKNGRSSGSRARFD